MDIDAYNIQTCSYKISTGTVVHQVAAMSVPSICVQVQLTIADSIQHATHAPTSYKILITSAQLKSDWQVAGLLSADIGWRKAGQSLPLLRTLAHLGSQRDFGLLSTSWVYLPSVCSEENGRTGKTLWYKRLKYKSSLSVMATGGGSATLALNSDATMLYKAVFAVCASSRHKSNSAKTESLYKTTRDQIQRLGDTDILHIEDRSSTADRAPQRPFRSKGNTTAVMLRNLR